jgi:hypothetical protein
MAGIFISYRRDDASGHAGRLFDRLAARFGRDRVFMDVTDIAPGEDFAHAIETSVGSAELLLAVIGPQWIGAVDDRGRRRIDESADFVRQEIAAGFQHKLRIIPVLVRGARMPREDELPEPLKALAGRQAVELTDARWESDVALFEQALAERLAGPAPTPRADDRGHASAKRGIVAAIAIALLVAGLAYFWRTRSGDGHEPATPAVPQGQAIDDTARPEINPGRLKVANANRALPLPSLARFKLAGQQFEILGLRTEPVGNDLLTIRLRMTNNGPYADAFTNVAAVLELGDESIAAAAPIFDLIPGYAAKEGELQFPLPGPTQDATLVLRYANQETRIPLSLKEGKPISASATVDAFGQPKRAPLVDAIGSFPLELELPARHAAQFGNAALSLRSLRLDRYNAERASLAVEVQARASPEARGGINFWSDNVRLYVDGVPRAPENLVNELVAGGTARTATFEFLLSDVPERLEVALRAGETESDRWPIAIPGVK